MVGSLLPPVRLSLLIDAVRCSRRCSRPGCMNKVQPLLLAKVQLKGSALLRRRQIPT